MSIKVDAAASAVSRTSDTNGLTNINRAGGDRALAVSAPVAIDSMRLTGEATSLRQQQVKLGKGGDGFDQRRIESLRQAVANGSYRVDPQKIADEMLKMEIGP